MQLNNIPQFGFGEIILVVVYLTATHYFVRTRVKDELKSIHEKIDRVQQATDLRLDEQELYIRRVNALAELNQRIIVTNPKMQQIIDRMNRINEDENR